MITPEVRFIIAEGYAGKMTEAFQYDVFISYSSMDKAAVRELAKRLKADGLQVWFDEWEIHPGDMIGLKIEQGLECSRTLVLVMSNTAFASEWVTLERHTTLFRDPTNARRRFVPLRLDDAEIKSAMLNQFAYVDWRQKSDEQYARLLIACRSPIGEVVVERKGEAQPSTVFEGHAGYVGALTVTADAPRTLSRSQKFIGREIEQALFEDLLKFATDARILAIKASGGNGKSLLLEKFQHRCLTGSPRTPVSLIVLDQLPDNSPLSLIQSIAEDLHSLGITFDNFERDERERVAANFGGIRSSAYLQGTNLSNARNTQISGTMVNTKRAKTVNVSAATVALTPEQETLARKYVIRTFFDDLHVYCAEKRVVIMLDSYDKCEPDLKEWIVRNFLERNFFSDPCESCLLGLVIAGKELPEFHLRLPQEVCDSKLLLVNELGRWTKENVAECLTLHGFDNYETHDLDMFYRIIDSGQPLSQLMQVIQSFSTDRKEQQ